MKTHRPRNANDSAGRKKQFLMCSLRALTYLQVQDLPRQWMVGRILIVLTHVSGENVNCAVKSPDMSGLSFLEPAPEASAKLKEPGNQERKFEDVVKSAERAAVRMLVY